MSCSATGLGLGELGRDWYDFMHGFVHSYMHIFGTQALQTSCQGLFKNVPLYKAEASKAPHKVID